SLSHLPEQILTSYVPHGEPANEPCPRNCLAPSVAASYYAVSALSLAVESLTPERRCGYVVSASAWLDIGSSLPISSFATRPSPWMALIPASGPGARRRSGR